MDEHSDRLSRFVDAQEPVYARALSEIRSGQKQSHWMWFVFPQIAGLGHSQTARFYAMASAEEARAYVAHPVLGARLRQCVSALQALKTSDAEQVFGHVDALKLRSSLTLFAEVGDDPIFSQAIRRWFGSPDERTLSLLR